MAIKSPKRRLQFGIATMLLAVTFVALIFWLNHQMEWRLRRIHALGVVAAQVQHDLHDGTHVGGRVYIEDAGPDDQKSLPWSLRLVGERGYRWIALKASTVDLESRILELQQLFPEAEIRVVP